MDSFIGYHSEWNLGSPGGWDYQRTTQEIASSVWERLGRHMDLGTQKQGVTLSFDHPLLNPVYGFVEMLLDALKQREGQNKGFIAVVAEEETLEDVTENRNLVNFLDRVEGVSSVLIAPHMLELFHGKVSYRGMPVSLIFMDFNTDVLLTLHRKQGLSPLLQAVRENRVINPRGTEPINVKSTFEVLTDPAFMNRFHKETIERTPWTRRFYPGSTTKKNGEKIDDLITYTRKNWDDLVLKPSRGYSGKGVHVGGIHNDPDAIIEKALQHGDYIVQEKIPLGNWSVKIPELDVESRKIVEGIFQTDFRCLFGKDGLIGFLGRFGHVPTNVGSGGGVHPLALVGGNGSCHPGEVSKRINESILSMDYDDVFDAVKLQKKMAVDADFTYLLGPIRIALAPRLITENQMKALDAYCAGIWKDCLVLEKMWMNGELNHIVNIEPEELEIAESQPWRGSHAIFAADGLFGFGAELS